MKKFLLLLSLILLSCVNSVQAQNNPEDLMQTLKKHRNEIYEKLNLDFAQAESIKNIDKKFYLEIEPELQNVSNFINRVQEIADSGDCTIKQINEIKREFKTTDKKISKIKCQYDKAVRQQLSREQKTIYKNEKRKQYIEIKKTMHNK